MQQADNNSHPNRPIMAWLIIIGLAVVTIGWGVFNFLLIPDTERRWDYGQLPDAPGESIYSTQPIPRTAAPISQFDMPAEPEQQSTQPAATRPGGQQ